MAVKKARKTESKPQFLSIEEFSPVEELGIELPQLVLGIELDKRHLAEEMIPTYTFRGERRWHKMIHHTSRDRFVVGTLLQPKHQPGVEQLARVWGGHTSDMTLSDLELYSEDLYQFLDATCEAAWRSTEFGMLAIDVSCLKKVAVDTFSDSLDDLIAWSSSYARAAGSHNRWGLWIFGEKQ